MRGRPDNLLLTAAGFGALAGLRSLSAPAFLSHRLAEVAGGGVEYGVGRPTPRGLSERVLASRLTSRLLGLLAAGEMAADKSSWIPRRIDPLPLAGRVLVGGLIGALLASRARRPKLAPLLLGGAGAVVSSVGIYYLRRGAVRRLSVPNAVAGAVEDGLVLALGSRLESTIH